VRAGWLMNKAQQHQAEWEISASIRVLRKALEDDPAEGFAHQLLGQSLVHGLALGGETIAVYDHIAEVRPDEPLRRVHAHLARLEHHRADRFLGPTLPWFTRSMAELEAVADDGEVPARARHEARLARRNLLFLVKDSEAARAEGLAAWELLPERLQGRITRLSEAVSDRDVAASIRLCVEIIETDPWAVEACSMIWGLARVEEPESKAAAEQARVDVLARVEQLRPAAIADPVIGNEVFKFYKRVKAEDERQALVAALREQWGVYRHRDARNWYMRGPFTPSAHLKLLQGTNRALGIAEPQERMARLRELAGLLPEPLASDPAVTRYSRALLKTARELGADGRAAELEALELLCEHDDGVSYCFELALELEEEGQAADRLLELTSRSFERLEGELAWVPQPDGKARFDFVRWAADRGQDRDRFREAEARWLASAATPTLPWSSALVDAWPPEGGAGGWVELARRPELPEPLALQAHLMALSLLDDAGRDGLDPSWRDAAVRRFRDAFPMVGAADVPPWPALLAAADARREAALGPKEEGKPPHPFVGHPAPALEVVDLEGRTISLDDLRGQVVLVDFWATWCGPCIKELPLLQAALEGVVGEPVRLLALSTDDEVGVVAPFLAGKGYTFDVAWIGTSGVKQDWAVRGIPSLFVIGPDGVVRHHHQGFSDDVGTRIREEVLGLLTTD
jgi:thiol-disulfide isomerase/thioredoxin